MGAEPGSFRRSVQERKGVMARWHSIIGLFDDKVISSAYLVYVIFLLAEYPEILLSNFDAIKFDKAGEVTAP